MLTAENPEAALERLYTKSDRELFSFVDSDPDRCARERSWIRANALKSRREITEEECTLP